mgnify:CR=1 FL=1
MTIENLAVMVQKGFKEVGDEFKTVRQEMAAGFAAVDKRFEGVDKRLMNLEGGVSYLKSRVEEIGRTLGKHSDELEDISKKLDSFTDPKNKKRFVTYQEFTELESRVTAFEKKIASRSS